MKYDSTDIDNRFNKQRPNNIFEGAMDLIPRDFLLNAEIQLDVQSDFK